MAKSIIIALFRSLPEFLQGYLRRQTLCKIIVCKLFLNSVRAEAANKVSAVRPRCIFIHIPKCAGTSISRTLFGDIGGGHMRAEDYLGIYKIREYNKSFKFAFVRNPWDRLSSAFFYIKSGGITREDRRFSENHLAAYDTFEAFVTQWVNPGNITLYHHFQPQVHFLCIGNQPPQLDFIGYFENLLDDFNFICNQLGVRADLAHLNRTKVARGDYRALYTDPMKQIVADVYARDISLLGYTFDNSTLGQTLALRETLRRSPPPRRSEVIRFCS